MRRGTELNGHEARHAIQFLVTCPLNDSGHRALAKDLTPYRATAHATGLIAGPGLAALNDAITGQAAFVGIIDQFEVMMIAMLIVSPLVLFLRKPH